MKTKNTGWERVNPFIYKKDGLIVKRKKLIIGDYWILYAGDIPLHIDITEKECLKTLMLAHKPFSLLINDKHYSRYTNTWQNLVCYHFGFTHNGDYVEKEGIKIKYSCIKGQPIYRVIEGAEITRIRGKNNLLKYLENKFAKDGNEIIL